MVIYKVDGNKAVDGRYKLKSSGISSGAGLDNIGIDETAFNDAFDGLKNKPKTINRMKVEIKGENRLNEGTILKKGFSFPEYK